MIRISKTDGLIGIQTTPTKLNMMQPKADFELNIEEQRLEIHTEQGRIQIDQQQCFNESGLKDFATLTRDNAMEAERAALEGIARIVDEGNMLAAIEYHSDAIAEIAISNSFVQHVFDIETMPKSRPEIDFIGGTVDIIVHDGYVDLTSKPNRPIIDVEVGKTDIYMQQHPDIKIEYVGKKLDELV